MGRTAAGPTNANPRPVFRRRKVSQIGLQFPEYSIKLSNYLRIVLQVTRMSDLNSAAGSALPLEIETQTKVYGTTDNVSSRPTGSAKRTRE